MKQEQEPVKRVVSKSEYAGGMIYKALVSSAAVGLCMLCLLCFAGICVLLFEAKTVPLADRPFLLSLLGIMAGGAYFAYYLGMRTVRKAKAIDPGVFLTRTSTAYLPANDSLVRASHEPTEAQKTVLLRAASQGSETPIEQLVRPAEAQE